MNHRDIAKLLDLIAILFVLLLLGLIVIGFSVMCCGRFPWLR